MSYWDEPEDINQRIYRGLVVQEFGPADVDALDYIRRQKGWD
jgi:hypothetical protein